MPKRQRTADASAPPSAELGAGGRPKRARIDKPSLDAAEPSSTRADAKRRHNPPPGNSCASNQGVSKQQQQQRAEAKFRETVDKCGGRVVGMYVNAKTRVLCICAQGHEYLGSPPDINYKSALCCPICAGNDPQIAKETFYRKVRERGGTLLGEYRTAQTPVAIRCKAGHEWNAQPRWVTSNSWCARCAGNSKEGAEEKFRQRVIDRGGTVLGDYVSTRDTVLVKCQAGHEWRAKPNWIVSSNGWCPRCAGRSPEAAEEKFRQRVQERGGTVLGEYVSMKMPILVRCAENHKWRPHPQSVTTNDSWCPQCRISHGEQRLAELLGELKIEFQPQFSLGDLLTTRRYDFGNANTIIEFDGQQHFRETPLFKNMTLSQRQDIDRIKTRAALESGRKIIRFHYAWLQLSRSKQMASLQAALASDAKFLVDRLDPYDWLAEFKPVLIPPMPSPRAEQSS